MRCKNIGILFWLGVHLAGCSAYEGFVETPFDQWETKRFEKVGLLADLPKNHLRAQNGAYLIKEEAEIRQLSLVGYTDIDVRMHPVWLGFMLEPFYRIEIFIARMSKTKHDEFKNDGGLDISGCDYFRDSNERFIGKLETYQMTTSGYGPDLKDQQWLVLRKDYHDETTGDYIVTGAMIFAGWDKFISPKQADVDAVSRILESVKVIGSGVRFSEEKIKGH
jgi:hypothetical protein